MQSFASDPSTYELEGLCDKERQTAVVYLLSILSMTF